jgi:hypothetical protein
MKTLSSRQIFNKPDTLREKFNVQERKFMVGDA